MVHVSEARHQFGEGGRFWVVGTARIQHQPVVVGDVGEHSLGFVLVGQHSRDD